VVNSVLNPVASENAEGGFYITITATCPAGKVPFGGGGEVYETGNGDTYFVPIYQDEPTADGWVVTWAAPSASTARVDVICGYAS